MSCEDEMPFLLQGEYGLAHQMVGSDGMLKAGVLGTRVNDRSEPVLLDAGQPLHERMLHDVKKDTFGDFDESEYRIIDDFAVIHLGKPYVKSPYTVPA